MTTRTTQDWHDLAGSVSGPTDLFIDGAFAEAAAGERFVTTDPSTGVEIAQVARAGAADVDRAVAAGRRAFESGVWSRQPAAYRKKVLLDLADAIDRHTDELAVLESRDGGKLISDTSEWDIPGTSAILRWYAETVDKTYGESAPVGPDALAVVSREPLGVIGAVVPWNFPLEMAMWKLAPALATGNSVVLKPAELTPMTALYLARLAAEVGLPDGVLNVVPGFGSDAGRALGVHMDVDAIAFTGSTRVGKLFLGYAGESNLKQVWPECGGKSAAVVCADVADLGAVADLVAGGIFACAGQVCSASSRLLVHRSRYDELLALVAERSCELRVGDPLDPETQMGPVISTGERDRILGEIESAAAESRLVAGGGVPSGPATAGAFLEPTILADVAPGQRLFEEEVFGPVLAATPFDTEEEAVALANSSKYALAASLFTDDLRTAHRVSDRLRAGTVTVNGVDAIDISVPFGGFGQSGYGRDLSLHALDKYTGTKTRWFAG